MESSKLEHKRCENSENKWNAILDRVSETNCNVICLQETKRARFDNAFLHLFCPQTFDSFEVLPCVGASGGSIIFWKSSIFSGTLVFHNEFASSVLLLLSTITSLGS